MDLSWTAASPDRVISSPTTSFAVLEFNRGTMIQGSSIADLFENYEQIWHW